MAVLIITLAVAFVACLPFIIVELVDLGVDARRFEKEMMN